ncbi:hypothetical protein GMB86_08055 [Terrilactibacillus sp. BCM23-1]|uniref:Uncharacterized protein n=1 Tax=Terrilactibacillus tamarindi TaxID=2599694 RepID=A0A6N8CPB5_9BACI|nr:hypothetical protein [Terrilactibacillus tamarindi]MTT31962.1 hypothetical protein [Terrilactibacillus tamarindi]
MNTIVSFKISYKNCVLAKLIDFYSYCDKKGLNLYISYRNKSKKITQLSEMLATLLTNYKQDFLIIIEGKNPESALKYLAFSGTTGKKFKILFPSYIYI